MRLSIPTQLQSVISGFPTHPSTDVCAAAESTIFDEFSLAVEFLLLHSSAEFWSTDDSLRGSHQGKTKHYCQHGVSFMTEAYYSHTVSWSL